jgi:hypothetical protein
MKMDDRTEIDWTLARKHDIWFSSRGIPLITQPLSLPRIREGSRGYMITVERYLKWYDLYVIDPSTRHAPAKLLDFLTKDVSISSEDKEARRAQFDSAMDTFATSHIIHPRRVCEWMNECHFTMDLQTYEAICIRYMQDYLEFDVVFTDEWASNFSKFSRNGKLESTMRGGFPPEELLRKVILDEDQILLD